MRKLWRIRAPIRLPGVPQGLLQGRGPVAPCTHLDDGLDSAGRAGGGPAGCLHGTSSGTPGALRHRLLPAEMEEVGTGHSSAVFLSHGPAGSLSPMNPAPPQNRARQQDDSPPELLSPVLQHVPEAGEHPCPVRPAPLFAAGNPRARQASAQDTVTRSQQAGSDLGSGCRKHTP